MGSVMRILLATAFALAAVTPALAAETPATNACDKPEFKQLDFWVGDWNAKWKGGQGVNHITKTYDGCVIEEHFDGTPSNHLRGHSVSMWFAPTKDWRQTWVDNEGSYIALRGGPDGKGDFVLTNVRLSEKAPHLRMVFTDIKPDSFTWRWQSSKTGKKWEDRWVIHYTRQKS